MTEQEKARSASRSAAGRWFHEPPSLPPAPRIVDLEQTIRAVAKRLRSAAEICRDNREMWAGGELEVGADALEDALGRTG